MYTGYQAVTPLDRGPRTVEEVVAVAAHIGAVSRRPLKHKALIVAATCAEKMRDLRTARAELLDQASEQLTAAGLDYAEGNATARDVLLEALTLAGAIANLTEIQRLAEVATSGINQQGLDAVGKIGETAWMAGLQVRAAELLDQANTVADQLGHEPAARQPNTATAGHPWAPSTHRLETDIDARHAWEKLAAILGELDTVHAAADNLRRLRIAGVVPGREVSEDYRWRHADRLNGNPSDVREFYLANRHHAEPGLYTAAELADTAPPNVRTTGINTADRFTAAHLADTLEPV